MFDPALLEQVISVCRRGGVMAFSSPEFSFTLGVEDTATPVAHTPDQEPDLALYSTRSYTGDGT
jgi:hypothetical protein